MASTALAASSVRRDNEGMQQADLGLDLTSRKTRKGKFLDEMNRVVPWTQLLALIEPHAPRKERGRPPFGAEVMLRIHFLQQWFGLTLPLEIGSLAEWLNTGKESGSDEGNEGALHAGVQAGSGQACEGWTEHGCDGEDFGHC